MCQCNSFPTVFHFAMGSLSILSSAKRLLLVPSSTRCSIRSTNPTAACHFRQDVLLPRYSKLTSPQSQFHLKHAALRSSKWQTPRASSASSSSSSSGSFPQNDPLQNSSLEDPKSNQGSKKSLLVAVCIPLIAGSIIGALNRPDSWYFQLKKPVWTPPAPLFGLAWSLIYPLMGVASWLVWQKGGWEKQAVPLTLYAIQLGVNLFWQVAFFGLKNPLLAFVDICVLAVLLAFCVKEFKKVDPAAGKLMTVYLLWVLFASALNFKIWRNNPPPVDVSPA